MYQEFFAGSRFLDWPLVALGIFFVAFITAVVYAVVGQRDKVKVKELSLMPLDDESDACREEARA